MQSSQKSQTHSYGWILQVYVTELSLISSLTRSHIITCPPLCAVSPLHVSLLARPPAAQRAQLSPGSCSKDCTWKGVMRWDVLQWAGKWRSVHHSWVMRWHALKHYTSLHVSLHSTSVYDLFPIWEKRKKISVFTGATSRVYGAVFSAFRGFNLKIMLLFCLKIAWEKIIERKHILLPVYFLL